MSCSPRADARSVSVHYQLLERWRQSQNRQQFERQVEQAVAYVEKRVSDLRAVEDEPERDHRELHVIDPHS
jgi:hypothetical protein